MYPSLKKKVLFSYPAFSKELELHRCTIGSMFIYSEWKMLSKHKIKIANCFQDIEKARKLEIQQTNIQNIQLEVTKFRIYESRTEYDEMERSLNCLSPAESLSHSNLH